MNSELETYIKKNVPWSKLPSNIKQLAFNSQKEYDKAVVNYSIKNQLRFRGNLIRHVRKDEQKYYEELLNYSQSSLLLYPYHLSDVIVKGMRVTPFQYYTKVLETIMDNERSYDSLPNFTAADCLRLLGIGRNEYIDLMNQCRSGRKLFRRKSVRDLLPSKPINVHIEPWWIADTGFITEEDVKLISQAERELIDRIIDCGKQRAGELDYNLVHSLYKKGLVFLEVPIESTDFIVVPPLEGFVMNRVLGDDFETLLYKIFVSIDEHTSVGELASVLQIELQAVKQAVSLYCRLGFARKKVPESEQWHTSWNPAQSRTVLSPTTEMMPSFSKVYSELSSPLDDEPSDPSKKTKIAFLFDSTLTAFLMMGNLSPGLKSHAVTMFEVGKLTEESMDSFLCELEKVSTARDDSEGEARRYFEHALVLRATILALRHRGLDLVRCESLQSLDKDTCSRLLTKNYGLLISMAPLSGELTPITTNCLPHLGPPCPQAHTPWFKLFLYHTTGSGPPSLLLAKGTRVNRVPKFLKGCDRVLVTSWGHDPAVVPISNLLFSLNDALCYSPVLVQVYGTNHKVGDTHLVPFPFLEDERGTNTWTQHPAIIRLCESVDLIHSCGFVTMVQVKSTNVTSFSSLPVPTTKDRLTLPFLSRSQPQLQTLDTPATPSTVEAWIETMEDGDINVKHYPPSPVKEEDGDPINGITNEECAEILENELDGLDSDQSSSPCRTAEASEELACSIPLSMSMSERKHSTAAINLSEWSLLDCCFGVPLFDAQVNRIICRSIVDKLSQNESLQALTSSNETLGKSIAAFVSQVHSWRLEKQISETAQPTKNENHWPTLNIMFKNGQLSPWDEK